MNNVNFWKTVNDIIRKGFDNEGLSQLERYAELFISEKSIFKRFSPAEQHGCSAGGTTHVIATIIAGSEDSSDPASETISDFKRELKRAAHQADLKLGGIRKWTNEVLFI
ncbi:MAG: hypothetical protein HDR95_01690 [Bacteroides sp.]|nr:hypothetical protein [Bacteroides sp.]